MTWVAWLAAITAGVLALRATHPCALLGHEPLLQQKRDADGRVVFPHAIVWECQRCRRTLGETKLDARWSLIARLRRQAAAHRRARKVA